MAIRKPGISSTDWVFQDFPYAIDGGVEYRYVQVKWDGERYTRISQTFDYSDPPFTGSEQKGGHIVCQIDYSRQNKLITIDHWTVNWRDEWPLRLGINYLVQCLYSLNDQFLVRVIDSEANSFWVSEKFFPISNNQSEPYLYYSAE